MKSKVILGIKDRVNRGWPTGALQLLNQRDVNLLLDQVEIDQQKELAECLSADSTKVTYKSLDCMQGHDSFLVDTETFSREISCYLKNF